MYTDIVVIGGGITGLSAAWHLQSLGLEYALLEGGGRWGGKLLTVRAALDGQPPFILDAGAESFITRKPDLWELAHEVGLGEALLPLTAQTRGTHILHQGHLHPVPLAPSAFLKSRLLSTRGKLRLLAEPFVRPRRDESDESLADFARRRLGREASMRLVEPILGGIYNADPERQSVMVSAPQMRVLEKTYGSLFRGTLARQFQRRGQDSRPAFVTLAGGVEALVTTLVSRLTGELMLNTRVRTVKAHDTGYEVVTQDGTSIAGRAVIIATPANHAAVLLNPLAPASTTALADLQHTSIGTVFVAYRNADLPNSAVTGVMLPRRERRPLDALLWTSRRIPGRAPEGYTLWKAFFGGAQPDLITADDEHLLKVVRDELKQLFNITALPVLHHVFRWLDTYPLSTVGHLARVHAARASLPDGVFVAGSSYEGVGVPDCIRQGRTAAAAAAHHLKLIAH